MNAIIQQLRALSDNELYAVSEAIDRELGQRADLSERQKGFSRSTYMADRVRGKRLAPSYRQAA
jgi:hypothetical protein